MKNFISKFLFLLCLSPFLLHSPPSFSSLSPCQKALELIKGTKLYLNIYHPTIIRRNFDKELIKAGLYDKVHASKSSVINKFYALFFNANNLEKNLLDYSLESLLNSLNIDESLEELQKKYPQLFILPYALASNATNSGTEDKMAELFVASFEGKNFFPLMFNIPEKGPILLYVWHRPVFLEALANWSLKASKGELKSQNILKKISSALKSYPSFLKMMQSHFAQMKFREKPNPLVERHLPSEEEAFYEQSILLDLTKFLEEEQKSFDSLIERAFSSPLPKTVIPMFDDMRSLEQEVFKLFKQKKFYEIDAILSTTKLIKTQENFDDFLMRMDLEFSDRPRSFGLFLSYYLQSSLRRFNYEIPPDITILLLQDVRRFTEFDPYELIDSNDPSYVGVLSTERIMVSEIEEFRTFDFLTQDSQEIFFNQKKRILSTIIKQGNPAWKYFFSVYFKILDGYYQDDKNASVTIDFESLPSKKLLLNPSEKEITLTAEKVLESLTSHFKTLTNKILDVLSTSQDMPNKENKNDKKVKKSKEKFLKALFDLSTESEYAKKEILPFLKELYKNL